ncbi:MAG: PEP-CTERM/exosortase system-associated acyltransferase [Candidatus Thiodiazotropha sp. (ex Notomyrtea botanica)]|nr:PEP-CTERM/exosortase system-associated acyltransferase [Candidatus Thiodiazotropha sp. (ex Notomyrtea botanica)]
MDSLAQNFTQYFRVGLAATRQQKRYAYAIRYQVYAEELAWEPLNESRQEIDACDDYAIHCLLEHKRSGEIAGCVRLVIPPTDKPEAKLPCQLHEIPMDEEQQRLMAKEAGEISRLAVPSNFRRRAKEAGKPFILDDNNTTSIYSEEERRNFPNISIGLYLAAIAMVELCELDRVLVVMEPRLQRCLKRYGLVFHKISETFDMKGQRALFELPRDELTINMDLPILELYRYIRRDLASQWQDGLLENVDTHDAF